MRPQPSGGFVWVQASGGPALVCSALRSFADHLFTTRDWALGSPRAEASDEDWQAVAASLGADAAHLTRAHQVHGAAVVVCRTGDAPAAAGPLPEADIIVSDDPERVIAIQTADCVPLLFADPRTGAVAAAHAGWRGLAAGVPRAVVAAMARTFGTRAGDLIAAIGPSIGPERYEVDAAVRDGFQRGGFSAEQMARWFLAGARPGHWQFDGWRSAADQLESVGMAADRIHVAALCTAAHPDLFCSYRRDGRRAGRIAGAIRMSGV